MAVGQGLDLPLDRIYYPVGLAADGNSKYLFVVSSDFDLQFNGGSVQSLSLERIRGLVPRECELDADCRTGEVCDSEGIAASAPTHWCLAAGADRTDPCAPWGERRLEERQSRPGRCDFVDLTAPQDGGESILVDSVQIKAFASDVVYRPNPLSEAGEGRLFIPVRGDSTLHWIDVAADGSLRCGKGRSCDARHRVGDDPEGESSRNLRLPAEPTGIAVTADGSAIVVTHESVSKLSLFSNDWSRDEGPVLEYLTDRLAGSPIGVANLAAASAQDGPERFLVGFRARAEIQAFGLVDGKSAGPGAPFLERVGATPILANYSGADSRGIAVDSTRQQECIAACEGVEGCQVGCSELTRDVYIANRAPSSLLVAEVGAARGDQAMPTVLDSIPVPYGPSTVAIGNVVNSSGALESRVFVISFDARRIGVFDPVNRVFERWIVTGRGPNSLLLDSAVTDDGEAYALAYVAHFTDSYLGVVQLDQRQRENYGEIVLTVGKPTAPRGSE